MGSASYMYIELGSAFHDPAVRIKKLIQKTKPYLLLTVLFFLFASHARALYTYDLTSNDDNASIIGDLGSAIVGINGHPGGIIILDLPSTPLVLGSVGGGLGSVNLTAPVTFSWSSGPQLTLEGTAGSAGGPNVNGGTGGNSVFNSTSNFSLDASGVTLGLLGGNGGDVLLPSGSGDNGSVTAGTGGYASLTSASLVLTSFSPIGFNFIPAELDITGGLGGSVTFSDFTGSVGSVGSGNGGSASVSLGFVKLGFGAFHVTGGDGGGIALADYNDVGIEFNALSGNGGSVGVTLGLVQQGGLLDILAGNGGSVTVLDLYGISGTATSGSGGSASVSVAAVSISGSQVEFFAGNGGDFLLDSLYGGYNIQSTTTSGAGGAGTFNLGSLLLKGTSFDLFAGNGGILNAAVTNLGTSVFANTVLGNGGGLNASLGPVSLLGSALNLVAGDGGGVLLDSEDGSEAVFGNASMGAGGAANVTVGSVTLYGANMNVMGGDSGGLTVETSGDHSIIGSDGIFGSTTVGAAGALALTTGALNLTGSTLNAQGGSIGEVVLNGQFDSNGLQGNVTVGSGGNAGVTVDTVSLSQSTLGFSGGSGGLFQVDADSGSWGVTGSLTGGTGGVLAVSMTSLSMDTSSLFAVSGGNGGDFVLDSHDAYGGQFGISNGLHGNTTAGAGGSAQMALGSVSLSGSQFDMTGGKGGEFTVQALGGTIGVNGAVTAGAGGTASLSMGAATFSGSQFLLSGGIGGSLAATTSNSSTLFSSPSIGFDGNSRSGAGGAAALTGSSVTLSGSNLMVSGGSGGDFALTTDPTTDGVLGNATAGNGGDAAVTLNSLVMDAASTFTVSGGTGGVLNATGTGTAVSGIFTAGTTGQAFVTLGSLNGSGVVSVDGTNAQLQVGSGNYAGVIEGNMNLDLLNGGALTLTGANLYSGGTSINASTLLAGNSSALGTGNVVNGGTLALSGPLTLNIGGNYTQSAGATLQLGLGPSSSQYDRLNITGTAALNGALKVISYGGFNIHDNETFTLLTAGSVTGTFSNVDNMVGGSAVSLVYQSTDVLLTDLVNPGATLTFAEIGTTPNQKSLGAGLDTLAGVLNPPVLVAYLNGQTNASLPGIYDQLSPASLTPLFHMGFGAAEAQAGLIGRHLDGLFGEFTSRDTAWNGEGTRFAGNLAASEEAGMAKDLQPNQWGVFTDETTDFGTVSTDGNGPGYQYFTGGMLAGLDYRFSKDWAAGLFFGYSQSGTSQSTGTVNATGGQEGFFAGMNEDGWRLNALAEGGLSNYSTSRNGWSGIATGMTQGQLISGELSAGYDFKLDQLKIGPYASGQYTSVHINAFNETGSLAPLSYAAQSEDTLDSDLGLASSWSWDLGGVSLSPSLNAAWEHIYQGNVDALSASFGSGGNFTVNGPATGTEAVLVGAGLKAQLSRSFNLVASYQGKFAQTNVTEQNVNAGLSLGF